MELAASAEVERRPSDAEGVALAGAKGVEPAGAKEVELASAGAVELADAGAVELADAQGVGAEGDEQVEDVVRDATKLLAASALS